jgi:signal peptidase I
MKEFWSKVGGILENKWVKFLLVTVIYVLWFVVWSRNWWMLLGVPVIYDIYISKYMYRLFWKKHTERKKRSKLYKEVSSWVEAILFAIVAASLIHIYVFQLYQIPTSSMEKTLLVGDRLYVNKISYGPRMPNTPLSFPLVHNVMPFSKTAKSYSEAIQRPYKRLAGFGKVERDDIVVFNFPAGDTVLIDRARQEILTVTYYDVLRDRQRQYGERRGREAIEREFEVVSRPVDKREHYVKRCVGLPGDTLAIESGQLYVNGEAQKHYPGIQFSYTVETTSPLSRKVLDEAGISNEDAKYYDRASGTYYNLPLTDSNAAWLKSMKNVVSVERNPMDMWFSDIFPNDSAFHWSVDNFGPLWIPAKGATVPLTIDNLPLYSRIIKNYEGHDLEVRESVIYIDGSPADSYTFAMDYYFMMGDNRHFSADSRYWGFVPEDHIVGKPEFIFWSTNKDKSFPKSIRWNRLFSHQ